MSEIHVHESHSGIAKRLKRADGHLRKVIEMIEAGRPCIDIAQQLYAVEMAIGQAKKALIEEHLDHCLDAAIGTLTGEQRAAVDDFKAITKYL